MQDGFGLAKLRSFSKEAAYTYHELPRCVHAPPLLHAVLVAPPYGMPALCVLPQHLLVFLHIIDGHVPTILQRRPSMCELGCVGKVDEESWCRHNFYNSTAVAHLSRVPQHR